MTTDIDLGSKRLFTEQPNQNNYVTIATVIASSIPLANIFNGQAGVMKLAREMTAQAQTNASVFSFNEIQKFYQFKMYKMVKSKVIFSAYISRVIPDSSQTNVQASQYYPQVQFKIDYDACCIGAMMVLLTTDIQVRGTLGDININGYTATGHSSGITISYSKDVKSIQYQYCSDFIYHYIDRVSIGWANTGGSAPVWHQEIPIEIVKIYHSMLVPPGMSETIARAVREDMFIIGHDPHRQFGDFQFQIKSPASIPNNTTATQIMGGNGINFNFNQQVQSSQLSTYGTSNELAMYWNDTEIKEVGFGGLTNTDSYSNPNNIQIMFKDPKQAGSTLNLQIDTDKNKSKTISKLDLSTELYWKFGSDTAQINLIENGNTHVMINSMSYIPIISNINQLVPIINALTVQTRFPYYVNTIDDDVPYDEVVYLIPYVQYATNKISFGTTIVTKLPEDQSYVTDETGVVLANPGVNRQSVLHGSMTIQVVDAGHNGQMVYNLTAAKMTATPGIEGINSLAITSYYDLEMDTTFKLGALQSLATYVNGNVLTSFNTNPTGNVSEGNSVDAGFTKCIMSQVQYGSSQTTLLDFVTATAQSMGSYLLQSTGALSPVMQQANIAYMNIVSKPYDENDLMLNSLSWYTTSNGAVLLPQGTDKYAIFRYNASIACNGQSEENYPAIQNIDDLSIHTFRKNHGVVDFYLPLQFLFICQDISQSFPHYACAAQSILLKLEFCNPLGFINTSISVRPLALDPLDFGHNERILINRVVNRDILQSNINNTKFVLYYTRYAWVPSLIPILTGYKYYSWVINNYERFYKIYENLSTNQQITLCQFNKSNFYSRIWAFCVNRETIEVINNKGAQLEYVPISVNRYKLESWDKMRFGTSSSVTSQGGILTGTSAANYLAGQNSVYFQVPFESCQLQTKTSINMTDDMPYRAQMLYPYLMLEHQSNHSALKFNNLLQFNIDSVFYQEGFPYCMYSPAFAPDFELRCTTKSGQQQDFGMIIIPEYKNISYISSHVMLLKYSSTN